MRRLILTHKVDVSNDENELDIVVMDASGQGNANHEYNINHDNETVLRVSFQNGPILENGVNGVTNEALLAIVKDRLEGFQSGPYACQANLSALDGINAALAALLHRTKDRIARGVEGRNEI